MKKIGAMHHKRFSKHPLFTKFSLFLIVSDVCNISNKYRLPHKLAKKCFYARGLTYSISFQKHKLFTRILLVFTVDEVEIF